jgi:hypothetical protein
MPKPFKGVVNVDVRESVPDREPYTQPIAPAGTPNVLYIVLDDVCYSAMEPFGLNIGKDGGEPVTDDYPGDSPWAFAGGTIVKAVIDVSGEAFVDLAVEAAAAFARD